MKISTPEGLLEIPQDLDFEIKMSHPFFSDEGASSIPVTIPATVPNCSILGHPERVDRATRYAREISAIAECGAFRKQCKVISESAGMGSGISMCLALNESEMYASVQDRKLKDLFAGKSIVPVKSSAVQPYEAYTGLHLYGFGYPWRPFPFALFPVAVDFDGNNNLVELNRVSDETIVGHARTVKAGERSLAVPDGYGIVPYMYLWYLIETAFKECGFGIGANCFEDDEDLKKIVVIHNHADVSAGMYDPDSGMWGFHYIDLVPDMTLGELIVWLHDKFGAVVRNDSGGIYIYLMRDLLTNDPDYDLTPLLVNDETISYPEPSTVERSADTSIKSAEPAADSLEALREKYPNCTEVASVSAITGSGLFHVAPLGKYYYKSATGTATLLGSSSFPYKRKTDMDAESISTDDPFLPSVEVSGKIMPFVGKVSHLYVDTDEEKVEQPLQICYAHDVLQTDGSYVMCGSSFSYDHTGMAVTKRIRKPDGSIALTPHPDLTPEGLAPYWSGYEKMLMNNAPEISLECEFPMADLVTINMVTPKLFKGAHVLIKEMTYKVTQTATARAKLTLQLIPDYTDMLLPASVHFGRNIVWKPVSTRSVFNGNGYTINSTDGLADYTSADEPEYTPRTSGIVTMKRSRWLNYTYTQKVKKWWGVSKSTYTATHKWEEYFISEASE